VKIKMLVAILVGILGISTCAQARPAGITLHDTAYPNSTVSIDPYSQLGIHNWTVDLYNQMTQSAYWYRIGGAGVASPVSSLSVDHIDKSDTDATVFYTGTNFDLQIGYSLGPGGADLSQSIMITNKTNSAMTFHLFEYVNFDLNGTALGETATHVTSSFTNQTEGTTEGQLNGVSIPAHWEIGDASTLLNKLNTGSFTNLADATSSYTGDAAFALQWDRYIAAYGASPIGQDLLVQGAAVPEPSSAMALIGALGLIPALRRRRR
jgi:hypothetical protein